MQSRGKDLRLRLGGLVEIFAHFFADLFFQFLRLFSAKAFQDRMELIHEALCSQSLVSHSGGKIFAAAQGFDFAAHTNKVLIRKQGRDHHMIKSAVFERHSGNNEIRL